MAAIMTSNGAEYNCGGDFFVLPIRAELVYGRVPSAPLEGDFHMAVSDVESNPNDDAAHWRVEAIRFRRRKPGAPLADDNMRAVIQATAERLYQRYRRQWE
jgi:hypothetical protein